MEAVHIMCKVSKPKGSKKVKTCNVPEDIKLLKATSRFVNHTHPTKYSTCKMQTVKLLKKVVHINMC